MLRGWANAALRRSAQAVSASPYYIQELLTPGKEQLVFELQGQILFPDPRLATPTGFPPDWQAEGEDDERLRHFPSRYQPSSTDTHNSPLATSPSHPPPPATVSRSPSLFHLATQVPFPRLHVRRPQRPTPAACTVHHLNHNLNFEHLRRRWEEHFHDAPHEEQNNYK